MNKDEYVREIKTRIIDMPYNTLFCADDVRKGLDTPFDANNGTIGRIFRELYIKKMIYKTGKYTRSKTASSHGRELRQWIRVPYSYFQNIQNQN